jgi:transposase
LKVRVNKTDASDAIGIAQAGRIACSVVSKVHLKTLECQSLQSRLAIRRCVIRSRVAAVNLLCRQLEVYGGRIAKAKQSLQLRHQVEAELRKLFGKAVTPLRNELLRLLDQCERLRAYQNTLDRDLFRLCSEHEICRRFLEIPGVGPICALTFYASVGDPHRFKRAADVGPYFGLVPKLYQSGLTSRLGRISKQGNRDARTILVNAGMAFMRCSSPECPLRTWAERIERERGRQKARVALARKLAIVMLAMWKKGENYKLSGSPGPI